MCVLGHAKRKFRIEVMTWGYDLAYLWKINQNAALLCIFSFLRVVFIFGANVELIIVVLARRQSYIFYWLLFIFGCWCSVYLCLGDSHFLLQHTLLSFHLDFWKKLNLHLSLIFPRSSQLLVPWFSLCWVVCLTELKTEVALSIKNHCQEIPDWLVSVSYTVWLWLIFININALNT